MINYSFKMLRTSDDGFIQEEIDLTGIRFADVTVTETLGDEMFIESGDLSLTADFLATSGSYHNWLALYINGVFYNVYKFEELSAIGGWWEEEDLKRSRYKYRLSPLQKIFYEDCQNTLVQYSADPNDWNFGLPNALTTIKEITIKNGVGGTLQALDRYGFSLSEMISWIALTHNNHGYLVNNVIFPDAPQFNDDDICLLFRGDSLSNIFTAQEAIDQTFYEDGADQFHMNWLDILQLIIFGWGAFISVRPIIQAGSPERLGMFLSIQPRTKADTANAITSLKWKEQRVLPGKYRIDGVRLTGPNFEYTQGNPDGNHVLERGTDVYDFDQPTDTYDTALYWCQANYDAVNSKYDIIAPYFASGLVEQYYADMISSGDGLSAEAEVIYTDLVEKLIAAGDVVELAPSVHYHINRVSIRNSILGKIEAVRIQ